jgi:membrane fusion protein, multidrug efflux system
MPGRDVVGGDEMNPAQSPNTTDAAEASPQTPQSSPPAGAPLAPVAPPSAVDHSRKKKIFFTAIAVIVLAGAAYIGIPLVILAFTTVSTDDAYVNSHVTAVAARVPGQVAKVLVDDNYRVKKGDLLVALDQEPYRVQVKLKEAKLATARAEFIVTISNVRGQMAQARSNFFKLQHAIEAVNNQVALLRGSVAALDSDLAKRERALNDYERAKELMKTPGAISPQDVDVKVQDYLVAKAKVRQTLQGVLQIRADLGLESPQVSGDEMTKVPTNLADAPSDLDQIFSTVRQAAADLLQAVGILGVDFSSFDLTPTQMIEEFLKRSPKGNRERIYEEIVKNAPAIELAKAQVSVAESDLDQAKLDLSYCEVRAEIDGVVSRRNVNPGNNVKAGQGLMSLRSLTEIWIDANFKETQLADLRIGQRAKIEADMYGSHHEFEGRITGFTMGTGQTLALLPPQNATGNFVKIVQRLPVKVELFDYDPDKIPLFSGLSVTPFIYIRQPLVGDDPGKGKSLRPLQP